MFFYKTGAFLFSCATLWCIIGAKSQPSLQSWYWAGAAVTLVVSSVLLSRADGNKWPRIFIESTLLMLVLAVVFWIEYH